MTFDEILSKAHVTTIKMLEQKYDGMTNGEVIESLFPNAGTNFSNIIDLNLWWKAKYKKTNVIDCGCSDAEIAESFIEDVEAVKDLLPQPKIGYCKDCKWQKDNDGMFRRGIDAESKCPMNRIEVYEGTGYCHMFKPKDSEERNEEVE